MTMPISPLPQRMLDDMAFRNMSPATQKVHTRAVGGFARYHRSSPDSLGIEHILSFDHLVGAGEEGGRQLQVELPCSFLVHDQLKFGWGLNRQFGRIGTVQDSINIGCCACDILLDAHPVRHKAADLAEEADRGFVSALGPGLSPPT